MNKQMQAVAAIFVVIIIIVLASAMRGQAPAPTNTDNQQPEDGITLGQPQVILEDGTIADPNDVVVTQINPGEEKTIQEEYASLIQQGTAEYLQDDYEGALTFYLKAQQVIPEHFLAYYNAGNAYKNLRQIAKAQEQLESALQYGNQEYAVYAALEEVYVVFQKDYDSARAMYQTAIKQFPEDARFYQAADNLEARIKAIESQ